MLRSRNRSFKRQRNVGRSSSITRDECLRCTFLCLPTLVAHGFQTDVLERGVGEDRGDKIEKTVSTVLTPLELSHPTLLVGDVVLSAFTPKNNGDKVGESSRASGGAGFEPASHVLHTSIRQTVFKRPTRILETTGPYGRTLSV